MEPGERRNKGVWGGRKLPVRKGGEVRMISGTNLRALLPCWLHAHPKRWNSGDDVVMELPVPVMDIAPDFGPMCSGNF